jgi:hypothetical protein
MENESEFKLEDEVKVKATGAVGRIEQIHNGVGKNWVEFNRDFATRQWFSDNELKLISRREDSSGPRFIPGRSIM